MEDLATRLHDWFVWIVTGGLFLTLWALERLREQVQELRYELDSMSTSVSSIESAVCPPERDDWPP